MSAHDHPQNLTAAQYRALTVLLTGGSSEAAAEAAGVSGRTLRRWQLSAEFADALRSEARESFRQAHTQLLAAQLEAVQVLRQAMRTGTEATRERAARTLLELGLKAGEGDREERLKRLEEQWRGVPGAGKSGSQTLKIV
jgi:HD-like signal output (HDOD) protein